MVRKCDEAIPMMCHTDMTATMVLDPQQHMEQLQEKCNDVVKVTMGV